MENTETKWIAVPNKLTFGMRVALEIAIDRHANDLDRVWREVLDFAPVPPNKGDSNATR